MANREKKSCDIKVKGVDICSLTKKQQLDLKNHAVNHSKAHIKAMVSDMINGISFNQSHKKAMKKVGE